MKKKLERLRAALVAAAMGATLSGCTEKEIRETVTNEEESVMSEIDEKLDQQKKDIKEYIDSINKTTTYEQKLTTTETTTTTKMTLTEAETTEGTTVYTKETTETTTTEKKEEMPGVYVENKYQYKTNGVDEYRVTKENGEYLYSIARKFDKENTIATLNSIKELNKLDENDNFIENGRTILLPFNILYYIPTSDEDLMEVSNETGISLANLMELNNMTNTTETLENKKIILTKLDKGQTTFKTERGTANLYQGNVVIADKIVLSTTLSNHLLTLTQVSETENYVNYLKFDGKGNYVETLAAINVEDIRSEEGYLIIETKEGTQVYVENNLIKLAIQNQKRK